MSSSESHQAQPVAGSAGGLADIDIAGKPLLFDLRAIDLGARKLDREQLERFNPQRGDMAQLDAIVWTTPTFDRAVGLKVARADEFWVAGHFPGKPMLPGVLMVEAAAQLANYCFGARADRPTLAAFLRIENTTFRAGVVPGDSLYLLLKEVSIGRRRFTSDVQGIVGGRIAFETRVSGLEISAAIPSGD